MSQSSYKQFCPVAMASEIICSRWTLIVLRELMTGTTTFNELRRGVPRMSPALLSKRLKELQAAGIVTRSRTTGGIDGFEYRLTKAGEGLKPVVDAVSIWGQRWVETKASLKNFDPSLLMWNMRKRIDPGPMPARRSTIQVIFNDQPQAFRNYWLVVAPGEDVDLCSVDPGFDVDLYLSTDLKTMTEVWMGYVPIGKAKGSGKLVVTGSRELESKLTTWFTLSTVAKVARMVA